MIRKHPDLDLIVTDIGGTIVKTDEAIISCIRNAAARKGIDSGSVSAIYDVFGVSLEDYVTAYLPQRYKDRTPEIYAEFRRIYPSQVLDLLEPFPRVEQTLRELRGLGLRLAVLSCMLRRDVDANLARLSFKDFDLTYSLDECGRDHKRPDPAGLLKLVRTLDARPEKTIYVGDTDADVTMAKNAGVISVAVRTGAQPERILRKANPDFLIDAFADIPRLLPHFTRVA